MSSIRTTLNLTLILLITLFLAAGTHPGEVSASASSPGHNSPKKDSMGNPTNLSVATFAGGCFWCVETDFEKIPGVVKVISGYTGGTQANPTYGNYAASGHVEAVQIYFDPQQVSYKELLDHFWREVDPTDAGGQFVDRGPQYRTAIFYHDDEQKRLAEESKAALARSGRFQKPIVTEIIAFSRFYPAEAYHQDFHKTHPHRYKSYRTHSGRDQFLQKTWGKKE
jgi:peptide methionine sulfoxide reductase msrA/msrB